MKIRVLLLLGSLVLATGGFPGLLHGQSVIVTAQLDTNQLMVGQVTTLNVFAQVIPSLRPNADRIFSWYVDVINTNSFAAAAGYDAMVKATSDNEPSTSSTGFSQGGNRRGIYDTFLNRPGAGVNSPVRLMAIPILGTAPGQVRFSVSAGTGVSALDNDFLVAPTGGGEPWFGGDYSLAHADLTVSGQGLDCVIQLHIQAVNSGSRFQLQFTPCPGRTNTVVSRTALGSGPWVALPGAPHNSGTVLVTNTLPQRFFRVEVN